MGTEKTGTGDPKGWQELGDETFMSADDLRRYMSEMQMARATQSMESMDRAEQARKELVKQLTERIDLTPERLKQVLQPLRAKLRAAAERGDTELLVMRFPNTLCSDRGRAINNSDPSWPDTLTGRPRQAYELWQSQLKDAGFSLSAMIIEWPGGMPGDVGFFLKWGASTP
ncbi:hypothetical protein [Chelatococcus asaccharovorans]|uniref:Uncharacterized protein n=1 Tax=Chelatococcus asaccharovorans TaxID=28210 RepID=A0A2V3UBR8_9HYPH|nr:hypothetical protein [Chelatococcus asaccharovorans]MBS7703574.1 hypothetical protein [Chelatococcus asaccharovorans]PXW61917.1 hypothetical protein C7450_103439 [Chelatococcus asaccharovorans]